MSLSTHMGDLKIVGTLTIDGTVNLPAGTVKNADVSSTAAIDPSKVGSEFRPTIGQEASANAAVATNVIHVARAAGTVEAFEVGLITAPDTASGGGGRTSIVDLKKNGTTVLTAPITLNSTNTAYIAVPATIASAAYVDGDVFTLVVTAGAGTTGTYPKGVFAAATLREAAA